MRIGIIGAGIGGLTAAMLLEAEGHEVVIYEKRHVMTQLGVGLGIAGNALYALKHMDIAQEIRDAGNVLTATEVRTEDNELLNQLVLSYSEEENVTIQRSILHELLLKHVISEIRLMKEIECIHNFRKPQIMFTDQSVEQFDLVIAADGIHSKVRQQMFPNSTIKYQGYTCFRGTSRNNGNVTQTVATEYWGEDGRFGVVPMSDNEVYWYACMNAIERDPEFKDYELKDIAQHFSTYPELVKRVLHTNFVGPLHHDIYDINPLKSFVKGRVVLLGDAAHAATPNMGQGASQAIEDAVCLVNQLKKLPLDKALMNYDKLSVPHTRKVILKSRQLGKAAQFEKKFASTIRNKGLKLAPSALLERQTFFLNHRPLN